MPWRGLTEAMHALVFITDPRGRNVYTNARFQDYTALPAEALLGDGWLAVVHQDDAARVAEMWDRAIAAGESYEAEYRLRRHDGTWRWFLCCGEPERDAGGNIVRWAGYAFDVEDRRAAEAAERELAAVLEATSDSVVALDRDWRVTFANRRAKAQLSGGADMCGQVIWEIFPEAMYGPFGEAYRQTMSARVPAVADAYYPPLDRYFKAESHPRQDGGIAIFFRDVTEERLAAARLAASEADLNDFFENAAMPLHWVGPDGTILRANRAELEMLGYSADEYVGRHIAEFHKDAPVIEDILQRLLAGEELHEYPARLRRKDGEIRDVRITSNARQEDADFIHSRCFTRDVTEQRQAEDQRLLLAREVDHRAKNALAVVQSLLRLTPTHGEEAERFARAVGDRIAAMARAHELLSKERWTGADLHAVVWEELAAYQTEGGDRVQLAGPSLRLPADVTQSISMLLHELATNAAKYGALSVPGGRVEIAWTVNGTAGGDLQLDWRESGGPTVNAPPEGNRHGFGSRLMEILARQFRGDVAFAWNADGLHCTLRLPGNRLNAAAAPSSVVPNSGDTGLAAA